MTNADMILMIEKMWINNTTKMIVVMFGLLGVLLLGCIKLTNNSVPGFSFYYRGKEFHTYYDSHNGEICLFLPSYISKEDIVLSEGETIVIDNRKVADSEIANYIDDREHTIKMFGREYPLIVLWGSESVATMYIDTESGSLKRIHADKDNDEKIDLYVVDENGETSYLSGLNKDKISGHGNTSWTDYDKKSYTLSLSEPDNVLSMGKSDKFVLVPNSIDGTNLRNQFAYELIEKSCKNIWGPESQFVDLYMNGNYYGLYLLCQKPTVYNIGLDDSEVLFELLSQSLKEIKSVPDTSYIINAVNERIRDIYQVIDGTSDKELFQTIDLDSWSEKYLIEEVLLNHDAMVASQFYHFALNDVSIYAGPAWDYDKILGGIYWDNRVNNPGTFYARRSTDNNWYAKLYNNAEFFDLICTKYAYNFRPEMLELYDNIDKMYESIYDSAYMNSKRWNMNFFKEDLEYLKKFILERIAFLDRAWIDKEETYYIEIQAGTLFRSYTSFEPITVYEFMENEKIEVDLDTLLYRDTGKKVKGEDLIESDVILINRE